MQPSLIVISATALAGAACGGPAEHSRVPAAAPSVANVLLTSDDANTPATVLPPGVAQVQLRLAGDLTDADALVAEVVPQDAPGRARRWPVDAVATAGDSVSATVTIPAYALPPGGYEVTIWRGDAEVVRRYPLRIAP